MTGRVSIAVVGLAGLICWYATVAVVGDTTGRNGPPFIIGRWDLVVHSPSGDYPSWLEVRKSGYETLVGQFVGQFGSVRPIGKIEFASDRVRWSVPPQWEKDRKGDLVFEGKLNGDALSGETTDDQGRTITWTGQRAAELKREKHPTWGKPIELFNGRNLDGWHARSPAKKHGWTVRNGLLVNADPGVDLVSDRKFTDVKLHAEFRYPKDSNSGIYLRGRYEVQIEDDFGLEPDSHLIGGIYGFLNPSVNSAKPAGEWQTIDVELIGRVVTVHLNGERIIDRQSIPGITGGALDSDERSPGPIMLQGDHGKIEFRTLQVTPAS